MKVITNIKKSYFKTPTITLQSINTICQALLLLLAVFGYFYTVKPIYTKARLEESIAYLESEFKRIEIERNEANQLLNKNYTKIKKIVYIQLGNQLKGCVSDSLTDIDPSNNDLEYEFKSNEGCIKGYIEFTGSQSDLAGLLSVKDLENLVEKAKILGNQLMLIRKEKFQSDVHVRKQLIDTEGAERKEILDMRQEGIYSYFYTKLSLLVREFEEFQN